MKKILFAAAIYAMVLLSGCKQVNAPLPGGAMDQVDATANSILQPAHAFASRMSSAVLSTDPQVHIELTAAQKTLLVNLNKALNIADPLEQAYHQLPTSTGAVQLQSATSNVSTSLTAAQSAIGK